MGNDSDDPESRAGEAKRPKIKAEDNPWYLLATLYGVPKTSNDELIWRNRVAWNLYFAANLDEGTRTKLIEEKRHSEKELTPFLQEELQEVEAAFAKRCRASGKELALPASSANIDFSNVVFEGIAFFRGYLFSSASFDGATFSELADFRGAVFSGEAAFCGAAFSSFAFFDGAIFSGMSSFAGVTFSGWTLFIGVTFSWANFERVTFSRGAEFDSATFSQSAYFRRATFDGQSSFVNAEMKRHTSFEGALFKREPPRFFGAKLHQGTVWRGITWPPLPKDKGEAGEFIDAYACLKLEMDRLKKHEDELDFFALELQSRRILQESVLKGSGLPIALYGLVSDYGRSYARPLYALFAVAAVGTLVLWLSGAVAPWQSLGLSFANTLNVFGFRKDFFDAATIENLPAALKILAALQTILGTILLFLFGLGVRNKFRMK